MGAVVGQHLVRRAVIRDRRFERLPHHRARAARVQTEADQEAAVVVHEADQMHAPVLALQDEGEEVRLPELIRLAALEATRLVRMRLRRRLFDDVALLLQIATDRARTR